MTANQAAHDVAEREQYKARLHMQAQLLDAVQQAVIAVDLRGKITFWNRFAERLYGWTASEVLGRDLLEIVPAQGAEERATELMARLEQGQSWASEFLVRRKDGTTFPAWVTDSPIYDAAGNLVGAVSLSWDRGPATDVTERERAEERVRHLNRVLRAIRNVNQLITRERDCDRLIQGACDSLVETRGYHNAWITLVGDAGEWVAAAAAETVSDFPALLERLAGGETVRCMALALAQQGVQVVADPASTCTDCPLSGECADRAGLAVQLRHGEAVYGLLVVSVSPEFATDEEEHALLEEMAGDIALALHNIELEEGRRRVEEALRESEEKFRSVIEQSEDGICIADEEGDIIVWNRSLARITGLRAEEMMGLTLWEAQFQMNPEDQRTPEAYERLETGVRESLETGRATWAGQLLEREYVRPDGTCLFVQGVTFPIKTRKGFMLGSITRDITERKRAQEALRASAAELSAIFDSAPVAMIVVDRERRVLKANRAVVGLVDRPAEEMTGLRGGEALRCIHALDDPQGCGFGPLCQACVVRQTVLDTLETGESHYQVEATLLLARGEYQEELNVLVSTTPISVLESQMVVVCIEDITERKAMEERLRRRGTELAVLNVIARKVSQSLDLEDVLDTALEQTLALLGAEGGLIYLLEEDNQRFIPVAHRGVSRGVVREVTGFRMGEGLSGRAAEAGEALVVDDLGADPRNISPTAAREGWRSLASVPMRSRGRVLGVMTLITTQKGHFGPEHVGLLNRLGAEVGVAIQNAQLYQVAQQEIAERVKAEREREQLLAQVREQAHRVQQILATVPAGVLLLDAEGRVLQANPVAEKDLAVLAGAGIGDVLTHLGDRPLAELLTSPPTRGLWHEVQADGRTFEVIARPVEPALSVSGGNGAEPEYWVLVTNDVTREREIQTQLEQQERLAAVGQLAAGIAHDFNNIMAVIVLYAQMAARSEVLSERDREGMAVIIQQAWHANRLIGQILDFGRRAALERCHLDLLPLLKEQVRLLERTLPEHIRIELDYGQDEYMVDADPTRIQQVITNLAVNARDAMPGGGTLRIGLKRIAVERGKSPLLPPLSSPGEWIRLRVSDTGMGIPPEVLPHIFEPFFTTKGPGEGSGLGLAQVHGIVGQHGGRIGVDTQLGEGTTFTIYLPALGGQPAGPSLPDVPTVPQGEGEVVLVVEDGEAVRAALVAGLEQLNYRTLEAANGLEAVAVMEERGEQVGLVLSDVVMPGMGGQALFHALRERGWRTPVVLLTGHSMERELDELRKRGLAAWLPKPPSLERLAQAVADALGK